MSAVLSETDHVHEETRRVTEPWQVQLYRRSLKKRLTVQALLDHLPPVQGRRCLELGCATGITSYFLRQKGGTWTHADFETEHVASAKQLLGPQADVRHVPEDKVPFEDAAFDVVVAINFLEHLHADVDYVREMVRVLKPGGDFLITAPTGETRRPAWVLKRALGFTAENHGFGHARNGYPPAVMRQLLRDQGLEVQGVDTYSRFFTETLEDVLNFGYHKKATKGKPKEEQDFHGTTSPMSGEALHKVGLAYRAYSAVYPALKLWTQLDRVIKPVSPGYMLAMWARKPAATASSAA
jgi:SAM-dependent methyltransferase